MLNMLNIIKYSLLPRHYGAVYLIQKKYFRTLPQFMNFTTEKLTYEEWHSKLSHGLNVSVSLTIYKIMISCYVKRNKSLAESFIEFMKCYDTSMVVLTKSYYLSILARNEKFHPEYFKLYEYMKSTKDYQKNSDGIQDRVNNCQNNFFCKEPPIDISIKKKGFLNVVNSSNQVFKNWDTIFSIIKNEKDILKGQRYLKKILELSCLENRPLNIGSNTMIWQYLQKNNIKYEVTKIPNNGPCPICGTELKKPKIYESDVEFLKNAVEKDIVKGTSIFMTSTPAEWVRFKHFLENIGQIDVVVDGLNISHSKFSSSKFQDMDQLRYLFIGKDHAKKNISETAKTLSRTEYFYVDNESNDDVFVIYATLYSGFGTKLLSGDYLRQHKKFSDRGLVHKFEIWQRYHQLLEDFNPCSVYDNRPQYNGLNTFHIPSERTDLLTGENSKWLCVTIKG